MDLKKRKSLRKEQKDLALLCLKTGTKMIGGMPLEEISDRRGREKISEPMLVRADGIYSGSGAHKKEKRANLIREIHRQVVNVEDGQLIRAYQIIEGPSDLDEYRVQYYR